MPWYEVLNKVKSPRVHLTNKLREAWIYSEFKKEWFTDISENKWYYFSQELIEKNFNFEKCTYWELAKDFMDVTGFSRPKINSYIERHWKVFYFESGFYDLQALVWFIKENQTKYVERRWRPKKNTTD